jgi:hypothetical protein
MRLVLTGVCVYSVLIVCVVCLLTLIAVFNRCLHPVNLCLPLCRVFVFDRVYQRGSLIAVMGCFTWSKVVIA